MNEKMKFVIRVDDSEKMTDLCREFGISRKTGYKLYNRYKESGIMGLEERKRGPKRAANTTAASIQQLIIRRKKEKPTWGAPKIREWLIRKYPNAPIPVKSTVHAILDRHGLVKRRKRRYRYPAMPTNLSACQKPNDLWCADFKGQFKMGNNRYCYALTVTDQKSRYLISCEGLESIKSLESIDVFEGAFREYGLPIAIRTDNGEPFSSRSIWGLSVLSVWWLRLGIKLERIHPGHPEQNGRHERMHRTLKMETTKPAGKNLFHQQELFDQFIIDYNHERPHEALNMRCPADIYKKSPKSYPDKLPEIRYDDSDYVKKVNRAGTISLGYNKSLFISAAFRGQPIGITRVDDDLWQVDFMDYKIGFFDTENYKLAVADMPFSSISKKVLPNCSV